MSTKRYYTMAVIILSFAFVISYLSPSFAGETRVVRLYGGTSFSYDGVRAEPATLKITEGGVVVWNNWARSSEVKIIFEDGRACQDVTDAPMGFTLDAKHCYVTTWIPLGGTSSLKFNKKGRFNYNIEASGGVKTGGTILVD